MKVDQLQENLKYCALLLHEMEVKENLVYDKYTGGIVGFTSPGTVNNELSQLERECQADSSHPQLAKQVLKMIRGIFFKLDLLSSFWHPWSDRRYSLPHHLESCSVYRRSWPENICIVADGASSNRIFSLEWMARWALLYLCTSH